MNGEEPVGSVGDEAVKLFGALAGWASEHTTGHPAGRAEAPECSWCPLCRTVHAVKHANPEVRAQLTTAAQSLLQAASALLAAAGQPEPPASRVQRIDLDGDPDDDTDVGGADR